MVVVGLFVFDDVVPTPNALEGVTVRVYSEDGLTFITEGVTDAAGELSLLLPDATTYWVRFFRIGNAFPTKLLIDVDSGASSNDFDVVGRDLLELPPSTVPYLCRASGYVVNTAGEPVGGARMGFNVTDLPEVLGGQMVMRSKVIAVSEADGYVEVELAQGGVYDVLMQGYEDRVFRVKVPERQAINISELIRPYVAAFRWGVSGPISMAAGDVLELEPYVLLSSGVQTPYDLDGTDRVRFGFYVDLSVDSSVVSIMVDENSDKVTLSAATPGTTTLSVSLRPDVEAKRLPPVSGRVLEELTVIVT